MPLRSPKELGQEPQGRPPGGAGNPGGLPAFPLGAAPGSHVAGGSGCARDVEVRRQVSALKGARGRGGPASRVQAPKACVVEGAVVRPGRWEPRVGWTLGGGRRTSVETPQVVDRLANCLFLP